MAVKKGDIIVRVDVGYSSFAKKVVIRKDEFVVRNITEKSYVLQPKGAEGNAGRTNLPKGELNQANTYDTCRSIVMLGAKSYATVEYADATAKLMKQYMETRAKDIFMKTQEEYNDFIGSLLEGAGE